ncbi:MAG: hypothetical protein R3B84_11130 [Zavarzinella sp.]
MNRFLQSITYFGMLVIAFGVGRYFQPPAAVHVSNIIQVPEAAAPQEPAPASTKKPGELVFPSMQAKQPIPPTDQALLPDDPAYQLVRKSLNIDLSSFRSDEPLPEILQSVYRPADTPEPPKALPRMELGPQPRILE